MANDIAEKPVVTEDGIWITGPDGELVPNYEASMNKNYGAELGQRIADELDSLVHRGSLQPGHRPSSRNREWPCSLEGVLPMLPDRSVTYVPGLYPSAT